MRRTLDMAAVAFTLLFLGAFTLYSARGLFAPELTSARFFGLPATTADGELYYRVYLWRNLVVVAVGVVFLARRQWQPLAVLTTAAVAAPLFDGLILRHQLGGAAQLTFHVLSVLVIAIAAALLWLRVRRDQGGRS